MSTLSVAIARWGLHLAPGLTARLVAPRIRGVSVERSTGSTTIVPSNVVPQSVVVVFSSTPAAMRWISSSLAKRLSAAVVIPDSTDDPVGSVSAASQSWGVDLPVTVVGEDAGAPAALDAGRNGVRRVALINPQPVHGVDARGVPTTFIQESASSPHRAATVSLERELRAAGVGVRETGYDSVSDAWARLPRASAGAKRALDDLVGFLERGVGPAATFDVIPGWDLH